MPRIGLGWLELTTTPGARREEMLLLYNDKKELRILIIDELIKTFMY